MAEIFLILLILWIFISLVVASNAKRNGKTRLWGIVVFVLGIFGLIFYTISLASD